MFKNKLSLSIFALLFLSQFITSQNNTNSPYTRFGYGDISDTNSGEQRAMGGVAFGSRSKYGINTVNPASYSSVDSTTFMFDIGLSGFVSTFKDPTGKKTSYNSNIEYVTMEFPLSRHIGFSAGLLPYSFSGYNFYSNDTLLTSNHTLIPDTLLATQSFYGLGSISQVYTGISMDFFRHVSLGVNAYYMFGNLSNYRNLTFNNTAYFPTSQSNSIIVSNFRFRYGLQLYNTFNKKHDLNLGLIFENKAPLNGTFSKITSGVIIDSILPNYEFELPAIFGLGLHYTYDKRLTLAMDYSVQKWADTKYFSVTDTLSNRSKFAFGVEYQPNPRGRKYSDKILFRAGLNISDSYIKVNDIQQPKNFGVSFGIGLPLKNSNTVVNASVEYGKIGSASILREDYFKFTFNAAFNENWFFKRKL